MDFSKLSYTQIQSLADQLKNSASSMETLLTEIKALFEKIGADDVWSGTAASNTKEEFDALSAKFPEFSQSITDCYNYLVQVVANYKSVDSMISGK